MPAGNRKRLQPMQLNRKSIVTQSPVLHKHFPVSIRQSNKGLSPIIPSPFQNPQILLRRSLLPIPTLI